MIHSVKCQIIRKFLFAKLKVSALFGEKWNDFGQIWHFEWNESQCTALRGSRKSTQIRFKSLHWINDNCKRKTYLFQVFVNPFRECFLLDSIPFVCSCVHLADPERYASVMVIEPRSKNIHRQQRQRQKK